MLPEGTDAAGGPGGRGGGDDVHAASAAMAEKAIHFARWSMPRRVEVRVRRRFIVERWFASAPVSGHPAMQMLPQDPQREPLAGFLVQLSDPVFSSFGACPQMYMADSRLYEKIRC
jgi:hypothetical protein